ncbi:MAG: methionine synthase [Cyanobacteria bacterium]|nr:methionine synthase [Cyanobacteriota bacterium]
MSNSANTAASPFFQQTREKVLIFDGGMGTCIQNYTLTLDDFEGLDGCNEILVKTRPQVIQEIHAAYFEAGADVVETNSFGSNPIVLAEYDIPEQTYELNRLAARLAKDTAMSFSSSGRPRFVAGSMGPSTKLPTLGHISYADMKASYVPQAEGLIDGGADILLIETCQDLLQSKAALSAVFAVKHAKKSNIPVMVQVTIEATGTMLVGSDIASVLTALEPYPIDVLGMNCATGPNEMAEHVRYLAQNSPFYISCLPNAGIPENVGGKAHYHLTPEALATHLTHFVKDLGVNIVGGCCGTTPDHIRVVSAALSGISPAVRKPEYQNSLSSLYSTVPLKIDQPPVLVGERTNANGSKLFRDRLQQEDYDGLVDIGKGQVKQGAHVLDVCTAYVGRDEVRDMSETVLRFNGQLDVPLMIDSTEVPVIQRALSLIAGKAIVNSINLEDGEERLDQVCQLCSEFGAAVVALTIDEDGMAKTADKKLAIARRIFDRVTEVHHIRPSNLVFDTLTFTLGSGDEEFRKAGVETIEAIRLIKENMPEVSTVLGISNISFGLKPAARHVLNSVFMHEAVAAGLDMAIINSQHILPLHRISDDERTLCLDLIYDRRRDNYDPLIELMAFYEVNSGSQAASVKESLPEAIEERLKYRIINGEKTGLEADLEAALNTYPALEIINTILLDGMKTVGDLFGRGEMQLPFVLQSAEVMKTAVAFLEPYMEKSDADTVKGTVVLATVKGDVHDIGKNLVDIILTNNGYRVINLGIKQPLETMLQAQQEHHADAIGMSGLLVKSTAIMKENLAVMKERGVDIPVILGGAALTPRFVTEDCQAVYEGPVYYAKDAFSGLHAMENIMQGVNQSGKELAAVSAGLNATEKQLSSDEESVYQVVGDLGQKAQYGLPESSPDFNKRSESVRENVAVPAAPFLGTKVVSSISLLDVYPFINTRAMIAGQWQIKRGSRSAAEYETYLQAEIIPEVHRLQERAISEGLLEPQVIYGYFPCAAEGNTLIIYRDDLKTEWQRFQFPRGGAQRLCIADYFRPIQSNSQSQLATDVIAMQMVTVGQAASRYGQQLFAENRYQEYLYFHGFSVEMAEATAEYWHQQIRREWNIANSDADDLKQLLNKQYQGCRYSFGYPACPNLEDQKQLFTLLEPERIGVYLSEEFMLEPEQSTSAIIVHHPDARYFDVRQN